MTDLSRNWSAQKERAAMMRAQGENLSKIARTVGVNVNTMTKWNADPFFKQRIEEHLAVMQAEIMKEGIANKQNRMREYADLYDRLKTVVNDRAEALSRDRTAVGGRSGVIVASEKMIGQGMAATQVTEYVYDSALTRDMLLVLKQTAQETGDWTEKSESKQRTEITGDNGGPVEVNVDYKDKLLREVELVAKRLQQNGLKGLPTGEQVVDGAFREVVTPPEAHRNGTSEAAA